MSLTPQWLDELRSRITLSTLIGRHVKVIRAGREYKACCPFHNEKTPSFTINDEKAFYHCFGCGAHGDAIRFMTDHQGLGFMDAVKELASEAGMTMPAPDPRAAQRAEERASLHDVMQAAQNHYVTQLASPAGAAARDYLRQRGLKTETLARFGFGFAPDRRDGIKTALADFDDDLLIEAGMLIAVDGKAPYDRFRSRIMIPIRDARGRVIAFGGRILGDGEPKYLNSPETPLFDKGRTLYNLDIASVSVRKSGQAIIVEGYMDVIALAQAGFDNAMAPLGTALTEHQIERLWTMTDQPILCFDGDNAGQRAAMRAAGRAVPMLKPGHSLSFITMPTGLDPDDYVRDKGATAFANLLAAPQSLLERLWQHELAAAPVTSPEAQAGFKKRLMDHADQIGDSDIRALYRRDFSTRFSQIFFARKSHFLPAKSPKNRNFDRMSGGKFGGGYKAAPIRPSDELDRYSKGDTNQLLLRAVLYGLLGFPPAISRHFEALSHFHSDSPEYADLLESLLNLSEMSERLDTEALLTILGERGKRGPADRLLAAETPPFSFCNPIGKTDSTGSEAATKRDLNEAIEVMTIRPQLEAALREVTARFEETFDDDLYMQQQKLRKQKQEFDDRLMALADTIF